MRVEVGDMIANHVDVVTADGVIHKYVTMVDEEKDEFVKYLVDQGGKFIDDGTKVLTETVKGRGVKVRLQETAPSWAKELFEKGLANEKA